MNPDFTKTIGLWPQEMKNQLRIAIEDTITGQDRFSAITISDIQVAGSRYFGGFKNRGLDVEKSSDLDTQIFVNESGVSWGIGFDYFNVRVHLKLKTKPLANAPTIVYGIGRPERAQGYNLPVYSLTNSTAHGSLTHPDIETWKGRKS